MTAFSYVFSAAGVTLIVALGGAGWKVWQRGQPERWLASLQRSTELLAALPEGSPATRVVVRRMELEAMGLHSCNRRDMRVAAHGLARVLAVVSVFVGLVSIGLVVVMAIAVLAGPLPASFWSNAGLVMGAASGVTALVVLEMTGPGRFDPTALAAFRASAEVEEPAE